MQRKKRPAAPKPKSQKPKSPTPRKPKPNVKTLILPPVSVLHGQIVSDRGTLFLISGGLRAELSVATSVPATVAGANGDRRKTEQIFGRFVGREIVVTGRQIGNVVVEAHPVDFASIAVAQDASSNDFARIRTAISENAASLLAIAGVVGVRPGFKFVDGVITNERCIVVIVSRKRADVSAEALVPSAIAGIATDVAPATPLQQLLSRLPDLPTTGSVLGVAGVGNELIPGDVPTAVLGEQRIVASKYVPPPDLTLDLSTTPMTVLAHLSPDAGFPTLAEFLAKTERSLTVAMYDFTAPHVEKSVQSAVVGNGKTFELVLDPKISLTDGTGNPNNPKASDIQETQVRDETRALLGDRFKFRWAAVSAVGKTTGGLFPSAYHIKVAVRDSGAFWLSSGNWQSSNQPDIDPLGADRDLPNVQGTYNREWHVIVDEPSLASTYEKFIAYDYDQAAPFQADGAQALVRPDIFVSPQAQAAKAITYFPPQTFDVGGRDGSSVQPLLTPDNYASHVLALITSAQKTLYFQNQYIKLGKQNPDEFMALVDAIVQKMNDGLDVRIILRAIGNTRMELEQLKTAGFDMSRVRLQKACHTKGIIVDGQAVCVGSHNWSGDGTVYNRDASLIFRHPGIARYFQTAFLYDWDDQAIGKDLGEAATAQIAVGSSEVFAGLERVPWSQYYDADDLSEYDDILDRLNPTTSVPIASAQALSANSTASRATSDLRTAKAELQRQFLDPSLVRPGLASVTQPEANVCAIGLGEKISQGRPTGMMAVKLYVETKFPREYVPQAHMLPTSIGGVPVDIEEIGVVRSQSAIVNPRATLQPPQPGSSIGYATGQGMPKMAGTFGAVVVDRAGNRYVLSNSHVLANRGLLPVGTPIYQAGLLDDTTDTPRQIARLARWIDFAGATTNIDCAIAMEVIPGLLDANIISIGKPAGVADAALDMVVHKFGRTSAYTIGRVTAFEADIMVQYETGPVLLTNQTIVEGLDGNAFSSAGDSGSLVLERTSGVAVGLLCAGSATHSIVNHLGDVLTTLQVRLETDVSSDSTMATAVRV